MIRVFYEINFIEAIWRTKRTISKNIFYREDGNLQLDARTGRRIALVNKDLEHDFNTERGRIEESFLLLC